MSSSTVLYTSPPSLDSFSLSSVREQLEEYARHVPRPNVNQTKAGSQRLVTVRQRPSSSPTSSAPSPAMPAPFAIQQPLPALYLYPLNDSFIPKHIHLPPNQHVKIGRQTNAKTAPGERNGFFDSKVLSRQHAEVWEESGKIYIKDVKSSNGTFINGERLSPESAESDPFELKTDDIVEFGIDIVGEDNRSIIHHKVAARVVCVITEQDAQAAARVEQHQHQNPPALASPGSGGANGANPAFNFAGAPPGSAGGGQGGPQRRPTLQQGLVGMGGMGGNMRAPGKSGLTFDHILSRLQSELQKSRETGTELHLLTGAMNEIQDTLGGNLPQNMPPFPHSIPPVREPPPPAPADANAPPRAALADLQAELRETQASLATHIEKIHALEGVLAEHDAIKREVGALREQMEAERRDLEHIRGGRREEGEYMGDEEDDARSINTVTPHELERVEEEDEEQLAAEEEEEERRRRRAELGRPRTPEPTSMGMEDDDYHGRHGTHLSARPRSPSPPRAEREPERLASPLPPTVPDDVTERLNALSLQLETALELSRTLQTQHATAQSTISTLESKVTTLESLVQTTHTQAQAQTQERASLTDLLNEWKKGVEGKWSGVQEEWAQERTRLGKAHDEWETRMRTVESGVSAATEKVESGLANIQQQQQQQLHAMKMNGSARPGGGLVTPPSPRSLSSDSAKQRHRRKRSASSRGRSRSRSLESKERDVEGGYNSLSESATLLDASAPTPHPNSPPRSRPRSPWMPDDSDSDVHLGAGKDHGKERPLMPSQYPMTPESSVRKSSTGSSVTMTTESDAAVSSSATHEHHAKDRFLSSQAKAQSGRHMTQVSIGFIVLSMAAAAVLYRVKTE